jgi:hypothetical protein
VAGDAVGATRARFSSSVTDLATNPGAEAAEAAAFREPTRFCVRQRARPLDYFACDGWVGKDVLYVDDEGLYEPNAYFIFKGCGQELFPGTGVVAGTDDHGETVSAVTTLDDLKQRIIFLDEPPRPRV